MTEFASRLCFARSKNSSTGELPAMLVPSKSNTASWTGASATASSAAAASGRRSAASVSKTAGIATSGAPAARSSAAGA